MLHDRLLHFLFFVALSSFPTILVSSQFVDEDTFVQLHSIPSWASPDDICIPARSCHECLTRVSMPSITGASSSVESYCQRPTSRSGVTASVGDGITSTQCCTNRRRANLLQQEWQRFSRSSASPPSSSSSISLPKPLRRIQRKLQLAQPIIPNWASQKDSCQPISSCDECATDTKRQQYCLRYDRGRKSECCTSHSNVVEFEQSLTEGDQPPLLSGDEIPSELTMEFGQSSVGSHLPVPVPALVTAPPPAPSIQFTTSLSTSSATEALTRVAHSPHKLSHAATCVRTMSCDECLEESHYCVYNKRGVPKCCTSPSTSTTPTTPTAPTSTSFTSPATLQSVPSTSPISRVAERHLPSWASPSNDNCAYVSTCDRCATTPRQYCHLTPASRDGEGLCCVAPNDTVGPILTHSAVDTTAQQRTRAQVNEDAKQASSDPIVPPRSTSSSVANEVCFTVRSCLQCGRHQECVSFGEGKLPQCCHPPMPDAETMRTKPPSPILNPPPDNEFFYFP